jgi:hypothetical protein
MKQRVTNRMVRFLFLTFLRCILTSRNKKTSYSVRAHNYQLYKEGRGSNKLKRKRRNCAFFLSLVFYSYTYNPTTRLCLTATAATIACIYVIRELAYKTEREQMAQSCLYVHIAIMDIKSFASFVL